MQAEPPIRALIAPVTPLQQNCTIVWCAKTLKAAIIDPGGEVPRLIEALKSYDGTMLFVSHDRHFLAELSNRVLELTPEGIHAYGGGYTEYVARTGREAPGLRS